MRIPTISEREKTSNKEAAYRRKRFSPGSRADGSTDLKRTGSAGKDPALESGKETDPAVIRHGTK